MGNVTGWVALACIVVACGTATTVASRFAYGDSRSIGALKPAELEARFQRARRMGWYVSLAWTLLIILALLISWPPRGLMMGTFGCTALLLVALLIGLDHPRMDDLDERYFDE